MINMEFVYLDYYFSLQSIPVPTRTQIEIFRNGIVAEILQYLSLLVILILINGFKLKTFFKASILPNITLHNCAFNYDTNSIVKISITLAL